MEKYDKWKVYLTITINFISSKDENDDERVMYSKEDNIEIIINDKNVTKNLFQSLKNRYQDNLKKR